MEADSLKLISSMHPTCQIFRVLLTMQDSDAAPDNEVLKQTDHEQRTPDILTSVMRIKAMRYG